MGCDEIFVGNKSTFFCSKEIKDGLNVYYHLNYNKIFFESDGFICPLCKNELSENETQKIKSLYKNSKTVVYYAANILYPFNGNESISECKKKLADYDKFIKGEENYLKTLYYKHKCIKKNQEIYLYLYYYNMYGISIDKYVFEKGNFKIFFYEISKYIDKKENKNTNYDNYDDGKMTKDGYFKGKKLCGKVQVVNSFPDFRVQVVDSFPDLRVQKVENFPNNIGQWQFVDSFPDFKIQYVDSFPDFRIKFVDSFPGVGH